MLQLLDRLLCLIGSHDWVYPQNLQSRECARPWCYEVELWQQVDGHDEYDRAYARKAWVVLHRRGWKRRQQRRKD